MNGHPPNEAVGGAQAKTGLQAVPINRGIGFDQTEDAMQSKVRSPYNAADGPNYHYKDIGKGTGGNVIGYGPGVGGSSDTPAGTHP